MLPEDRISTFWKKPAVSKLWVLARTGASALTSAEIIQELWGGCGRLLRIHLADRPSVILKHIEPPAGGSAGDQRKRRSYEVEWQWYREHAPSDERCRVARCLACEGPFLLLEDLANAGFERIRPPREEHVAQGLRWLAHFHRTFLGERPPGLWEQGTYWHLATRQEEWARMVPGPLKDHAEELDRRLREARFQTVVHGDAKPSNFLWGSHMAAAVDFQYVGPGCGIRDVAYFLDCCSAHDPHWLDLYFETLQADPELEREWRELFPVAWSDYARFYQGWAGSAHLDAYTQMQLQLALGR